jgi:hypothetical protein
MMSDYMHLNFPNAKLIKSHEPWDSPETLTGNLSGLEGRNKNTPGVFYDSYQISSKQI